MDIFGEYHDLRVSKYFPRNYTHLICNQKENRVSDDFKKINMDKNNFGFGPCKSEYLQHIT